MSTLHRTCTSKSTDRRSPACPALRARSVLTLFIPTLRALVFATKSQFLRFLSALVPRHSFATISQFLAPETARVPSALLQFPFPLFSLQLRCPAILSRGPGIQSSAARVGPQSCLEASISNRWMRHFGALGLFRPRIARNSALTRRARPQCEACAQLAVYVT